MTVLCQISLLCAQLQDTAPLQTTIEQSLDYVESQQNELSSVLESYEKLISDMLGPAPSAASSMPPRSNSARGGFAGDGQNADEAREKAYRLAESLNAQLNDMSHSLGEIINEVNSLSSAGGVSTGTGDGEDEDPVAQITAILNGHMQSLAWVERTSDEVAAKVADMENRVSGARQHLGINDRPTANGASAAGKRFGSGLPTNPGRHRG